MSLAAMHFAKASSSLAGPVFMFGKIKNKNAKIKMALAAKYDHWATKYEIIRIYERD